MTLNVLTVGRPAYLSLSVWDVSIIAANNLFVPRMGPSNSVLYCIVFPRGVVFVAVGIRICTSSEANSAQLRTQLVA